MDKKIGAIVKDELKQTEKKVPLKSLKIKMKFQKAKSKALDEKKK